MPVLLSLLAACVPAPIVAAPVPTVLTVAGAGAVPLAAQGSVLHVSWTQAAPGEVLVAFSFDPGVWVRSPLRSLGAGDHEELLLGIPYGETTTWRLEGADGRPLTAEVSTANDPLPDGVPEPDVLVAAGSGVDAAPFLFTALAGDAFGDPWWRVLYDRAGRVVWANRSADGRASLHARVAADGRSLYLDQNSFWSLFDDGAASTVEQTLLDGTILHTFATPGLHHPFTDLPDGSVAYGAVQGFYSDEVLTRVGRDGAVTELWACQDLLEALAVSDRCGSNSLSYEPVGGRFLYSFYSFETVVEIDAATGDPTRWFGHLPGSPPFVPEESTFWWQHGATWTGTHTLLVSTDRSDAGEETVAREYRVDAAGLTEVWSFGEGEGLYGEQMGEAVRLDGGNTWHNYGQLPRLREVTPAGVVVWDLVWDATAIGRTMPVADLYALVGARE